MKCTYSMMRTRKGWIIPEDEVRDGESYKMWNLGYTGVYSWKRVGDSVVRTSGLGVRYSDYFTDLTRAKGRKKNMVVII